VLPGAWSAYRYRALLKSDRYEPNLLEHSYFKMLLNPNIEEKDFKEANMYLAEDRILSLGIYCQPDEKYYLKYVPNAIAKTDPMKSHEDLMKQRRRWINSSMFAFLYVWKNFQYHVSQSRHSGIDKYFRLNIAMLLSMLSLITTYFSPTLIFYILFTTILQISITTTYVFIIARVISTIFVCFYLIGVAGSLMGNIWIPYSRYISVVMAFFTFGVLGLVLYNIVGIYLNLSGSGIDFRNFSQMSILVIILVNLGIYLLILLLHLFTHPEYVWKMIVNQLSYVSYQGAYTMTMIIHAFCNIDDVSWGTKGSLSQSGSKKYETEKIKFVGAW
jgi:cellulose synthase/poly-beta-1,6-N-acetylglucosamine synthase-like glycosyltransferase